MFLHDNVPANNSVSELFKPLKDSASLRVCNEKNFGFGFQVFCE